MEDLAILLELVRDFHLLEHLAYDRNVISGILSALIANPNLGQLWIAEAHGSIQGYAVLGYGYSVEYGGRDAFIDEIYLSPDVRGHGLGTAFLLHVRDEAWKAGVSVIHLEVDHDNARAFEVYSRFGFKPKNRKMMSLWMNQKP